MKKKFFIPQKNVKVFPWFLLIEKWQAAAQVRQRKIKDKNTFRMIEIPNLPLHRTNQYEFIVEPQCTIFFFFEAYSAQTSNTDSTQNWISFYSNKRQKTARSCLQLHSLGNSGSLGGCHELDKRWQGPWNRHVHRPVQPSQICIKTL